MTRERKQKKFLDSLGLSVGDYVRFQDDPDTPYKIIHMKDEYFLQNELIKGEYNYIYKLMVHDFKSSKPKRKYKDMACSQLLCAKCPLVHTTGICEGETPQEKLDSLYLDDEEREFYQKRIDREYKED